MYQLISNIVSNFYVFSLQFKNALGSGYRIDTSIAMLSDYYCRPGGTGPVGKVLAGPTFQRENSKMTIFTVIFKGCSI